eukprot:12791233-Alexandrium_andersonii.AAC.1
MLEEARMSVADVPMALAVHGFAPKVLALKEGPLWRGSEELWGVHWSSDYPMLEPYNSPCMLDVGVMGALLRAPLTRGEAFEVPPVWGRPPREPNVHTDGSLIHGVSTDFRLAGAAVVLSEAQANDPTLERTDFHLCTLGGGHGARDREVPVLGQAHTAHRAEVLGVAVALMLPFPVNVGCDSLNTCRRLQNLISEAPLVGLGVGRVETAWRSDGDALIPDGDLWAMIRAELALRGAETTTVTKVKAHVERHDLDLHGMTEHDWLSNALADETAKRAVASIRPWAPRIACSLAARQRQSDAIVMAIHRMQVDILRESSEIVRRGRGQAATRTSAPGLVHIAPLQHPEGERFDFRRCAQLDWLAPSSGSWQSQLAGFMWQRQWVTSDVPLPWVAMLVAFEHVAGATVTSRVQQHVLDVREPVRVVVQVFKRQFLALLRDAVHPEDAQKVKQSSVGKHALNMLAFKGFTSSVSVVPCLSQEEWLEVSCALLSLRNRLPTGWLEAFRARQLFLPVAPIVLTGLPRWR